MLNHAHRGLAAADVLYGGQEIDGETPLGSIDLIRLLENRLQVPQNEEATIWLLAPTTRRQR